MNQSRPFPPRDVTWVTTCVLLNLLITGCRASPPAAPTPATNDTQTIPVAHTPSTAPTQVRIHLDHLLEELDVAESRPSTPAMTSDERLALAKLYYYIGVNESPDHTARADALLDALLESNPDNTVALAYSGSNRLLDAAGAPNAMAALGFVNQGLQMLDHAVEQDPDNLEVRFVRARSTLELPPFFGRKAGSEADFARIAQLAEPAVADSRLEPRMGAAALFHHGVFRWERKDPDAAIDAWQRAVALDPESLGGQFAADLLAGRAPQP